MSEREIERLIQLADAVLEGQGDEQLESLDLYVTQLDVWLNSSKQPGEALPKERVIKLEQKHAEVLSLAKRLKASTLKELKSIKTKARAIRAYSGLPSERISRNRARKG